MATSLSKLKTQIAKLQKQATAFQSTVVSRIKKEIAKHGLSIDDLFDSESKRTDVGRGTHAPAKAASKSRAAGAAKPPKFSDGQGNTWHGIGKRPQWIHAALDAGHSLDDFLIGAKAAASAPAAKPAPKAAKSRAAGKNAAAKKAAVEGAAPLKKAAKTAAAKKSPKAVVAAPSAKTAKSAQAVAKSPAKKAPARKAASKRPARTASQPTSVPAAAAPAPQS